MTYFTFRRFLYHWWTSSTPGKLSQPGNDNSKQQQHPYRSSRIIATTGWTTDELEEGISRANDEAPLKKQYDFVSLLIGVNNQVPR